ncbi:MAG TPA: TetR family transcriptional regulator [Terracidiphilus sp.]|jgi:AcrR family transcriptional regulator|nr:TetR family transcriptional regulator [Terracidiphilus sp.]
MKNQRSPPAKDSRRKEYAAATKLAILQAARNLFSQKGYFSAKVDDIAALARVSPATIYAVSGGKQGLLRTLMDQWTTAPVVEKAVRAIDELTSSEAILRLCAATCVSMRKEYGDTMRVILSTAPHDREVASTLDIATERYRKAILRIARRMVALGDLRKSVDLNEAADVLWFYFGYASLFTLIDENHWSWDRAEEWLYTQACRALLRKH